MAKYTGSALVVTFGATTVEAEFKEFETSEEMDLVDQSAGNDTAKTYLTALEDGSASLTLLDQVGNATIWGTLDKGNEATLLWAPEGTASTKPKHSVNAIVKSREKTFPYDDVVELKVEFQFSGAVTDSTYA